MIVCLIVGYTLSISPWLFLVMLLCVYKKTSSSFLLCSLTSGIRTSELCGTLNELYFPKNVCTHQQEGVMKFITMVNPLRNFIPLLNLIGAHGFEVHLHAVFGRFIVNF